MSARALSSNVSSPSFLINLGLACLVSNRLADPSISHSVTRTCFSDTTRAPRPGEEHGKHYYFVSRDEFLKLLSENAFIEHAEFSGNFYGTSFMTVREVSAGGRRCILDIEAQVRDTRCSSYPLLRKARLYRASGR